MTSLYTPSPLRPHTRATAEAVNAEHNKIQAALDQLQAVVTSIITGTIVVQPLYTWRAYANSADGTIDFTTGVPSGQSYIGFAFNQFVQTPAQTPSSYEWSLLQGSVGNIIAFDTLRVSGKASSEVVDDLNLLSVSLLAYQFDRQTLQDYVNARLFVGGLPVNAVVISERNIRIAENTALAETVALIGAKNQTGSAFIIDLDKTYVDATTSLGVRLTNMIAATGTVSASVQALSQVVAGLDYATATDLSLLGAKNGAGNAWIMNLNTVKVSPTETFSQYINQAVASAAGGAASVTQIYEAVISPTGGASAKAVLQLDVNGRVSSISATNNGALSTLRAAFDVFILEDLSGNPLFTASGGVVKMPNVEIDRLKVGSVTTTAIAPDAVQKGAFMQRATPVTLTNLTDVTIVSLSVVKDRAESDMDIVATIRIDSSDDIRGTFFLKEDGNVIDSVPIYMNGALETFRIIQTLSFFRSGAAAGNRTYAWSFQRNGGGNLVQALSGSNIRIIEMKR